MCIYISVHTVTHTHTIYIPMHTVIHTHIHTVMKTITLLTAANDGHKLVSSTFLLSHNGKQMLKSKTQFYWHKQIEIDEAMLPLDVTPVYLRLTSSPQTPGTHL